MATILHLQGGVMEHGPITAAGQRYYDEMIAERRKLGIADDIVCSPVAVVVAAQSTLTFAELVAMQERLDELVEDFGLAEVKRGIRLIEAANGI